MEQFWAAFLDYAVHLDQHLEPLIRAFGAGVYGVLFLTIFCETGLVIAAFLPGDSLLFAAGALAAHALLDIRVLAPLLFAAAVAGDSANYWIGRLLGPKIFHNPAGRWLNRDQLAAAHRLYERHGRKIILASRFIPLLRTLGPFVAGIASMDYRSFLACNVTGCLVWSAVYMTGGFVFGNLPLVREHLFLVAPGVLAVPLVPASLVALARCIWRKAKT